MRVSHRRGFQRSQASGFLALAFLVAWLLGVGTAVWAGEVAGRLVFQSEPRSLQFTPLEVRWIAFSPDGKLAATAHGHWTTAGCVRLWDVAERTELAEFPQQRGVVRFWDIAGRSVESEVQCDKRVRSCELVSEARRWLAAAGDPGRLTVWDMATSQRRMQYADLDKMSFSVDVSPDGSVAVTGGADPKVRLWALPNPPGAERTTADRIRVWGK